MDFKKYKTLGKRFLPVISLLFIGVVGYFLYEALSAISWSEVKNSLQQVSLEVLALTGAIVVFNYLLLTGYDYMGFRFLKTEVLKYKRVLPTSLICYAFNFNLGALIGGLAFRIRIYSGWGVPRKIIPFVALFTVMTTWIGYTLLISFIFNFRTNWIDDILPLTSTAVSILGVAGFLLVGAYIVLSFKKVNFTFKGKYLRFPQIKIALLQLLLSTTHWCLTASIIYIFIQHLGGDLGYGKILFTYLIASVGGVIARIPAGIGVIEAVFLQMQFDISSSTLLAALLCFRAVYYLFPLALAIPSYGLVEYYQKRKARTKRSKGKRKERFVEA